MANCLTYLNESSDESDGRLWLLYCRDKLVDDIAEISPTGGTLVAFKAPNSSWYGRKPLLG